MATTSWNPRWFRQSVCVEEGRARGGRLAHFAVRFRHVRFHGGSRSKDAHFFQRMPYAVDVQLTLRGDRLMLKDCCSLLRHGTARNDVVPAHHSASRYNTARHIASVHPSLAISSWVPMRAHV